MLCIALVTGASSAFAIDRSPIVIDAIVATVDDKPITLVELGKRLSPPRTLTLSDAASSSEAKQALDGLIFEQILSAEAERRNVRVSDEEVDAYVGQVAQRNSLSPQAFEEALKNENRSLNEYRKQIRLEILRSKIAANYVRTTAAVTDEDVEKYIKERMGSSDPKPSNGARIALRQIMLAKYTYTSEQAKEIFDIVKAKLDEGVSFPDLAKQYSNAPDAQDGGSLGLIEETDLSPEIFDAVLGLDKDEISSIVSTPTGFHIFQVIDRQKAKDESEDEEAEPHQVSDELRAQVRQQLEHEKLQSKMASFFESEILKFHTVDKKI